MPGASLSYRLSPTSVTDRYEDSNISVLQYFDEVDGRELAPLIGVEDVRLVVLGQHLLDDFDTKIHFLGDIKSPSKDASSTPVNDRSYSAYAKKISTVYAS